MLEVRTIHVAPSDNSSNYSDNGEAEMYDVYKTSLENSPIKLNEVILSIFSFLAAELSTLNAVSQVCQCWRERSSNLLQWESVHAIYRSYEPESVGRSREAVHHTLRCRYVMRHPQPKPFCTDSCKVMSIIISAVTIVIGVFIMILVLLIGNGKSTGTGNGDGYYNPPPPTTRRPYDDRRPSSLIFTFSPESMP
eukprot:PhF_6_TR8344/c4_g5_i3/m.13059